jgi:hypothetical protein
MTCEFKKGSKKHRMHERREWIEEEKREVHHGVEKERVDFGAWAKKRK